MKKSLALILLCFTFNCILAQKTIVLVHGAWGNSAVWYAVVPTLKAKGYEVITVNLPGHGADTSTFKNLTLKSYTDAVESAIGNRTNVILLGHSMGGLVISQVAEDMPQRIRKLIYLTAFVPKNGDSFLSVAGGGPDNALGKYFTIDQKLGAVIVSPEGVMNTFVDDAPTELKEYLGKNIKPEPIVPLSDKVSISKARFGKVGKSFIFALNDKAIPYPYQQKMVTVAGITETDSIRSSHCPMFSQPAQLVVLIAKQAQ